MTFIVDQKAISQGHVALCLVNISLSLSTFLLHREMVFIKKYMEMNPEKY